MKAKIIAERVTDQIYSPATYNNKADIHNHSTSIDSTMANSDLKKETELDKVFSKTTKNVTSTTDNNIQGGFFKRN